MHNWNVDLVVDQAHN
jgi:WD40 repeat protein